jgi:hypothetical protein
MIVRDSIHSKETQREPLEPHGASAVRTPLLWLASRTVKVRPTRALIVIREW